MPSASRIASAANERQNDLRSLSGASMRTWPNVWKEVRSRLLGEAGDADVEVFDVPGAFELPLAASYAARSGVLRAWPVWGR